MEQIMSPENHYEPTMNPPKSSYITGEWHDTATATGAWQPRQPHLQLAELQWTSDMPEIPLIPYVMPSHTSNEQELSNNELSYTIPIIRLLSSWQSQPMVSSNTILPLTPPTNPTFCLILFFSSEMTCGEWDLIAGSNIFRPT